MLKKSYRVCITVILVWIALQLPFLDSAFRIDEPLVLIMADQIRDNPLDPYGARVNWLTSEQPMFSVYANPPMLPYWIWLWSLIFPWSEVSLHVAMIPFAVIALFGFDLLARRYRVGRLYAVALLCCSPAFFLTNQVVMPDAAMFAFFLLTLGNALTYEEHGSTQHLIVAILAGFLTPLAKYNGAVLIPILAWLWLTSRRKIGISLILVSTIASLGLWSLLSWVLYGTPHILAMTSFQQSLSVPRLLVFIGSVCALGLGVVPLACLTHLPEIYRKRKLIFLLQLFVLPSFFWIGRKIGFGILPSILFALAILIALHVFTITFMQGLVSWRLRDGQRFLLVVWVVAGLLFQTGLMFSSVRYMLYLAPPAILLILLQSQWNPRRMVLWGGILANVVFVLALSVGDSRIAESYRWIVRNHIEPLHSQQEGAFYFSGHWGFQYYAERAGGRHIERGDVEPPVFRPRDILVVAESAWPPLIDLPTVPNVTIENLHLPYDPGWPLRTIDCGVAANFYTCLNSGCPRPAFLPWGFAEGASEVFRVYTFK